MDSPIVLVAGSLHYDVVVTADRLPVLDETLPGTSVSYLCGGKGSNQAVAAARHGAPTALAGVVGDDAFGKVLIDNLDHAGVDRSAVVISPGANSGMSVAIVTGDGEYGAVIVSAANLKIDATSVEIPDTVQVVLLQNEIPEKANVVLAGKARSTGAKVILNAAPARPLEAVVRSRIDLLTVNRVEAAALCGRTVETVADAIAAARTLAADGCDTIVTLGSGGAVFAIANGEPRHFPAPPVEARSTHGAGDAFVGALAARLALGADLPVALHYAQMAAALHVSYARDERESITTETVLARLGEV
jgi:ribokinase